MHYGPDGNSRLLVVLLLFLTLLTVAGIILSVVILTTWNRKYEERRPYEDYYNEYYKDYRLRYSYPPQSPSISVTTSKVDDSCKKDKCQKDETYVFAFGDNWRPHEYINETEGCSLRGLGPAIVVAACKAAGFTCKTMYTPRDQCMVFSPDPDIHPRLGDGVYKGAIDGCGGWFPNQRRKNVALFTDGWLRPPWFYLYYLDGNPAPTIGAGSRIGYVYTRIGDYKCLRMYLAEYNGGVAATLEAFETEAEAVAAFSRLTDPITAAFFGEFWLPSGVTQLGNNGLICPTRQAGGLLAHKRNKDLVECFNKGLETIRGNGEMARICHAYEALEWCDIFYRN